MVRIVLNLYGGIVQDAFATDPDVELIVVDWDTEDAADEDTVQAADADGGELRAFVSYPTLQAWTALAGTDTGAILRAAGVADAA